MPMERSKCPDCRKEIGGLNHTIVTTNARLTDFEVGITVQFHNNAV